MLGVDRQRRRPDQPADRALVALSTRYSPSDKCSDWPKVDRGATLQSQTAYLGNIGSFRDQRARAVRCNNTRTSGHHRCFAAGPGRRRCIGARRCSWSTASCARGRGWRRCWPDSIRRIGCRGLPRRLGACERARIRLRHAEGCKPDRHCWKDDVEGGCEAKLNTRERKRIKIDGQHHFPSGYSLLDCL